MQPSFQWSQFVKKSKKYFSNLLQIQSQKGQNFKNPAAEQRSSSQGCTVRAKAARGQSSL
jgi:hypothetical protein